MILFRRRWSGFNPGGAGLDTVYGGAGEDILIDLEGGDVIWVML